MWSVYVELDVAGHVWGRHLLCNDHGEALRVGAFQRSRVSVVCAIVTWRSPCR